MKYSKGQLETLMQYMEDRMIKSVDVDNPPPEVCARLRDMHGKRAWCTLLRGQCSPGAEGCRMEVRDADSVKPLPCPWCGGEAVVAGSDYGARYVRCSNTSCDAEGPASLTLEGAVAMWNKVARRSR